VSVKRENGYHFLDPTAETYTFDYLPESDQHRGVIIFEGLESIFGKTPLSKPEEDAVLYHDQIKIMPDGSIELDTNKHFSGSEEAYYRYKLIDSRPTEIKEAFEEEVYGLFPGAKLMKYAHSDPLDFKKRLEIRLKYHATDYCKKAGDILIFRIPDLDIGDWCWEAGKEERRYPVLHSSKSYRKHEVEFNIPEGYDVYYLPGKIEMNNPYFEYKSSYRTNGQKIYYQAELSETAVQIPAEEYDDYRNSCEVKDKSHKRYVLFKEKRE
jgi:hypothetical protein